MVARQPRRGLVRLGGCGSESVSATGAPDTTEPTDTTHTTEAPDITEPTDTTEPADTPGPVDESETTEAPGDEPTVDSATDMVVGLTEDEAAAAAAAEDHGWILRVIRRDGEDLVMTMDLRSMRVNVEVADGEVTAVLRLG